MEAVVCSACCDTDSEHDSGRALKPASLVQGPGVVTVVSMVDLTVSTGYLFIHTSLNQALQAVQSMPYTACLPFEQRRLILSGGPFRPCEWKDGDGTVCEELITDASVPEHLFKHGIEKLPCINLTTCHWVGCQRNLKPMKYPYLFQHSDSVTSFHYHPIRTYSLPVQSVSPKETPHTCQWMRDNGTTCGALITGTIVSDHLVPHGVKDIARDYRVACRWLGCKLRGDKSTMKRESITRHVREKQLGCKRPFCSTSIIPAMENSTPTGAQKLASILFSFLARAHKPVRATGVAATRESLPPLSRVFVLLIFARLLM